MAYERQYYTNGDVLDARQMNHMETGIKENSDNIDKLSEDIATKASAIKEKASGEVIVVTDSDEQKPLGLAIDGKSEQNQYSGNQLANLPDTTEITINGIVWTCKNGIVTANGTATDFSSTKGKISCSLTGKVGKLFVSDNEGVTLVRIKSADGTINYHQNSTFTLDGTEIEVDLYLQISTGKTVNNIVIYPMLNDGETELPWEPFVGGKPSPSNEYEQEIRNIGVYDEASGKYAVEVKCTGKNLLKNFRDSWTSDGVTITKNEDGSLTLNGTSTASTDIYYNMDFQSGTPKNDEEVMKNVPLTASLEGTINGIAMGIMYFTEELKVESCVGSVSKETTFMYPSTAFKSRTYIFIKPGTVCNNVTVYPMIRPAGTDDTYEPYKETTATVLLDEPLRKGDKAYWNGGSKVRVDRNRSVKVFDGSEPWGLAEAENTGYRGVFNVSKEVVPNILERGNAVCSHFRQKNSPVGGENADNLGRFDTYYSQFRVNRGEYDNVDDWKATLAEWHSNGNPLTLEYTLAEPITEEIDIDLGELTMFYPTTVISNDCNANMEVTYIADTKAYIDKKFAELATAMV